MKWHKAGNGDNSLIDRGIFDAVQRGLDGTPPLNAVPSPWHRPHRRRRTRRRPNADPMSQGKTPTTNQGLLPTDAVGNSPDGTGRT